MCSFLSFFTTSAVSYGLSILAFYFYQRFTLKNFRKISSLERKSSLFLMPYFHSLLPIIFNSPFQPLLSRLPNTIPFPFIFLDSLNWPHKGESSQHIAMGTIRNGLSGWLLPFWTSEEEPKIEMSWVCPGLSAARGVSSVSLPWLYFLSHLSQLKGSNS